MVMDIDNLVPPKATPDFNAEVLKPLKEAQAIAAQKAKEKAEAEQKAREEAERIAAEQERQRQLELEKSREVQAAQVSVAPPAQITGDCASWMAGAGITDIANASKLIMKESGCNPNAVNRSSGACGLGQQLPCGKWPHTWNEPVGALIDMQVYVMQRYGSWANAWAHSQSVGWY